MTIRLAQILFGVCLAAATVQAAPAAVPRQDTKEAALRSIEKSAPEITRLSDEIWAYAETALRETRSSKLLADWAEARGFRVTRGVAHMPTAFVAEFGSGKPVIGIMGEYDALPGVSQKALPAKEPLLAGAPGHGCGHNLFGAGSLAAADAIRELIAAGKLRGTIRFFGTPAEEAIGGKIYMLRDGVFEGVDVMLAWHPSDEMEADTKSSQALVDLIVEFEGRAAHAAYDPWNGRSAVDGLELFTHGVNLMREHIKPTSRMHYTIVSGGNVPNVIPEYAKVWIWLRDTERATVDELLGRVKKIAEGAALGADVRSKVTIQGGDWDMLVNMTGQRAAYRNLEWLGPVPFTAEERDFAKAIQRETGVAEEGLAAALKPFEDKPGVAEGGSTDVADVSWMIPTISISVTTAPRATPWHAWPVVATGGMSIGHKGMLHASKALAATMIDLFSDAKLRSDIRADFEAKTKGITYKPYIPEGPPPVPGGSR